jgi:putative addiction module component (TIGR02574 family)
MTVNALKLLEDALRLTEKERADLAARLIDSLDPEVDADVASAWDAEIHRRLSELDSGVVKPVPWPEDYRKPIGYNRNRPLEMKSEVAGKAKAILVPN